MLRKPFRLQRLLELRSRQVDACKGKLAEIVQESNAAEDALSAVDERGEALSREWLAAASAGLSAVQAVDFERALQFQLRDLEVARNEVERLQQESAAARGELAQATIKLKTLEKARERANQRLDAEEARQEQLVMDEFSILMEARA